MQSYAQTQISKIYRGYKARGVGQPWPLKKMLVDLPLKSKRYTVVTGAKKSAEQKSLDNAAEVARESVDPRAISQMSENCRRIQLALEEPETTPFSDEVLHLVRINTVIIQQSRGVMGFSEYNYINARYYGVGREDLTWQGAASMLNRSERLIRLIRSMAGPGEKPPHDPNFSTSTGFVYCAVGQS